MELETADNESSLELIVTLPTSEGSNGRSSSIDDDDLEDAQDDYYDNQDNNDRDDDRDDDDNETDEDDGLTPDGNNSDAASHARNDCSDDETNDAYAYAR